MAIVSRSATIVNDLTTFSNGLEPIDNESYIAFKGNSLSKVIQKRSKEWDLYVQRVECHQLACKIMDGVIASSVSKLIQHPIAGEFYHRLGDFAYSTHKSGNLLSYIRKKIRENRGTNWAKQQFWIVSSIELENVDELQTTHFESIQGLLLTRTIAENLNELCFICGVPSSGSGALLFATYVHMLHTKRWSAVLSTTKVFTGNPNWEICGPGRWRQLQLYHSGGFWPAKGCHLLAPYVEMARDTSKLKRVQIPRLYSTFTNAIAEMEVIKQKIADGIVPSNDYIQVLDDEEELIMGSRSESDSRAVWRAWLMAEEENEIDPEPEAPTPSYSKSSNVGRTGSRRLHPRRFNQTNNNDAPSIFSTSSCPSPESLDTETPSPESLSPPPDDDEADITIPTFLPSGLSALSQYCRLLEVREKREPTVISVEPNTCKVKVKLTDEMKSLWTVIDDDSEPELLDNKHNKTPSETQTNELCPRLQKQIDQRKKEFQSMSQTIRKERESSMKQSNANVVKIEIRELSKSSVITYGNLNLPSASTSHRVTIPKSSIQLSSNSLKPNPSNSSTTSKNNVPTQTPLKNRTSNSINIQPKPPQLEPKKIISNDKKTYTSSIRKINHIADTDHQTKRAKVETFKKSEPTTPYTPPTYIDLSPPPPPPPPPPSYDDFISSGMSDYLIPTYEEIQANS